MAENSAIEWTHHTFNPWRGCTKVSEGCAHCYAETMSGRNPSVLGTWGPNGKRVVAAESYWRLPLKWDREAKAAGERRRVFCASLADVFEDWQGYRNVVGTNGEPLYRRYDDTFTSGFADDYPLPGQSPIGLGAVRTRLFKLIDATPNLDWLLLTKRPENIRKMIPGRARCAAWPDCTHPDCEAAHFYSNVWYGTSVENQDATWRVGELLKVQATVRFLSCEPLLGPIELVELFKDGATHNFLTGQFHGLKCKGVNGHPDFVAQTCEPKLPKIDWVIIGHESGPKRRRGSEDDTRSIINQCSAAGVAVFNKQMQIGLEWRVSNDPAEWPAVCRIRQFPEVGACR